MALALGCAGLPDAPEGSTLWVWREECELGVMHVLEFCPSNLSLYPPRLLGSDSGFMVELQQVKASELGFKVMLAWKLKPPAPPHLRPKVCFACCLSIWMFE